MTRYRLRHAETPVVVVKYSQAVDAALMLIIYLVCPGHVSHGKCLPDLAVQNTGGAAKRAFCCKASWVRSGGAAVDLDAHLSPWSTELAAADLVTVEAATSPGRPPHSLLRRVRHPSRSPRRMAVLVSSRRTTRGSIQAGGAAYNARPERVSAIMWQWSGQEC